MQLSKKILSGIDKSQVECPEESYFQIPEKILQFGAGVLLRGLPDYFIDKANKQNLFRGRIVIAKSTGQGSESSFDLQGGLYTQGLRGVTGGRETSHNVVNASVSRVLSAQNEWQSVLAFAVDPALQIVISNTTEVGIVLVPEG